MNPDNLFGNLEPEEAFDGTQDIYNEMRFYQILENNLLNEPFSELPSREYPEYGNYSATFPASSNLLYVSAVTAESSEENNNTARTAANEVVPATTTELAGTVATPVIIELPATRKRKLYEEQEFEDPKKEKKRKSAIISRQHRNKIKQRLVERDALEQKVEIMQKDNENLRQQLQEAMQQVEKYQLKEREEIQLQQEFSAYLSSLTP